MYPEITRPNAVTAFSGSVLQILHMCEKISQILLPGKGVKMVAFITKKIEASFDVIITTVLFSSLIWQTGGEQS